MRCNAVLGRTHRSVLTDPTVWAITGLLAAIPAMLLPIFVVSAAGIVRASPADGTVIALFHYDYSPLAIVMALCSIALPVLWLGMLAAVMITLHGNGHPAWLGPVFRHANELNMWAMPDVFVMGGFVAYTRLGAVAHVSIGLGGWAYLAFAFCSIVVQAKLDKRDMWRGIGADPDEVPADPVLCMHCSLVVSHEAEGGTCPRCGGIIHRRKPGSIARCAALIMAAYVLYIPANVLPVLQTVRLGRVENHTIFAGAMELIHAGMWPLALIVFMASITVPVLKLLALTWFLISTQSGSKGRLHRRTRLYRVVAVIGRWSNIDVFMIGLLAALVQFGNLTTIRPAPGALAFAAVVVLTMLASHFFDSRLMWDAADTEDVT